MFYKNAKIFHNAFHTTHNTYYIEQSPTTNTPEHLKPQNTFSTFQSDLLDVSQTWNRSPPVILASLFLI
jgi:hypothetical protein